MTQNIPKYNDCYDSPEKELKDSFDLKLEIEEYIWLN